MYEFFLKSMQQYISFSPDETTLLTSKIELKKIRKKQWLVTPGDYCKTDYFVNKGCFRAYYVDENGHEHITKFATEGWWITDIQSYFSGLPATLYVESLEDGEVIALNKSALEALYEDIPQLNKYFRLVYQKAMLNSNQRVLRTISNTAGEHFLQFIEQYPNLEQRVPQYMIASYLGITPEFLSKIRRKV
jgi:CRP-like cAMP-binding protein